MKKMPYIKRAIENIKSLLDNEECFVRASSFSNDYYKFYAATNESLDYFADLNVAGKSALTVTGSGDHALNLAYFGAKSIETFDINELAIIAFDLKLNALLHLTRDEFIDFYSCPKFFDKKIYKKIYPYLNDLTKAVFNTIFKEIKSDSKFDTIIEEFEMTGQNILRNNPYLSSEEAYFETRRRIENLKAPIRNAICPVHKIDKVFDPKDIVILSNILKYCMGNYYSVSNDLNFYSEDKVKDFVKAIKNTLNDGGLASLLYFGMSTGSYNEETLKKYFNVNGSLKEAVTKQYFGMYRVFLAKKEDFPEFEM